jgi:ribosome-binding protein aMBF1 (putative translation factor)
MTAAWNPVEIRLLWRDYRELGQRTFQDLSSPELRRAIGDALREMRSRHGHSQESLARLIPCDRSQITRVELGRHQPHLRMARPHHARAR